MESPFNSDALKGKVALITGGGSGLGFEIATQFGKHGALLSLMGRRNQVLQSALATLSSQGIQAIAVQGDVRKEEDAEIAIKQTISKFGKLDILINGAAGNFLALAEDLSVNAFRTVLEIDTVGTYNMSRKAMHYLKRSEGKEGGVIINISATLQYTAAWFQTHVVTAKAGIDSMTRTLALEWGIDHGIRVNGIAPGPIKDTPGMDKLAPEELNAQDAPPFGEKWDIAMAALYLASHAGKYVNGAIIPVDGGAWFFRPPHFPKELVQSVSRQVEKRSREIKSKL